MGRLRGYLWLIAGIVVAVIAGGVAFITLSNATAERTIREELAAPEQNVVISTHTIDISTEITADDVELIKAPVELIPEFAFSEVDQVIGKLSLTEVSPGEIILGNRIADPNVIANDGRIAVALADEKVLMAYPASDLMSSLEILKAGDHVDFLYTMQLPVNRDTGLIPGTDETRPFIVGVDESALMEDVTFNLLQNVTISAAVYNYDEDGQPTGAPRAFLLTVSPQDALVLKYMKDNGAVVDFVLRAPKAEGTFSVEPVDLDFIINGYIVPNQTSP